MRSPPPSAPPLTIAVDRIPTPTGDPMTKTPIRTADAPNPAGPYSQGIVAGGFLFTAGFGPQDPATGAIAPDVAGQTTQVLRNIDAVLREAGASWADVIKVTAHLQHLDRDFAAYNEAYAAIVPEPYPVRTTVGSDLAQILVEIDVVAKLPE
jgi:2-iminobutanoate/2-iminopropanoate deaminase